MNWILLFACFLGASQETRSNDLKKEDMDMTKHAIEIIEFTDPVCTWCWGSEPVLRKLEYRYGDQVKIDFIMGGLVKDMRNFYDRSNQIGGDLNEVGQQIAAHWLQASQKHGMPVGVKVFDQLFTEEHNSTYPMNIAYKAAQMQDELLAHKYLRRIREAVSAEGKPANRTEILIELAQECGLDVARFITDFNGGVAEQRFQEDLKIVQEYRAGGFPAFLIRHSNGKEILLRGYQSYEAFTAVMNHLSGGDIKENKPEFTQENLLDFLNRYEKVTLKEVQETFEVSSTNAEKELNDLQKKNRLQKLEAGNGYFYRIVKDPVSCDSEKGLCGAVVK